MTPEDLVRLDIPSDPRLQPGGDLVAFTVSRMDREEDRYRRRIWVHDGKEVRPFTAGPGDSMPRWSPDGRWLAFLRAGPEKEAKSQLAVMAVDGGEPQVLTSFDLGTEWIAWSPDGTELCVVGVTWAEGWEGLSDEERSRRARRIKRFPYRFDNRGWLDDRRRHLWLIDPRGEKDGICLTPGDDFDEAYPAWSPDGSRIAFLSDRGARGGLDRGIYPWELVLETREVIRAAGRGGWLLPSYRPDGALHLLGEPTGVYPAIFGLWRRQPEGSLTDLTGHLDRSTFSIVLGSPAEPVWRGEEALLLLEDSGRLGVVGVKPDGRVDQLVGGDRTITGVSGDERRVVFTASEATSPGELYELVGDEVRPLTSFRPDDLEALPLHHWRVASDGAELDAFAVLPDGRGPFPLLLNIHGGPMSQYGFGFFDEFQIYAGAGFGVVACNPRGSSGRGLEFARAVVGEGWGKVDLSDITAVVDSALARFPQLDRHRLGIMGGSYGGFLTAWTIGHDQRYRSAVVERALLSFESFEGTSDIGPTFDESYTQTDDHQRWWEMSPMSVAPRIETPTLILHSEDDYRCPIEQAEQLFVALLDRGTEVELLRFPGEGHELSRSGKPRHRLERFEAVIDWHRRHLAMSPPRGGSLA